MYVSVDNGDIGYDVFLDGVQQHDCVAADDELGAAWVLKRDGAGNFVIVDDGAGGHIPHAVLLGNVVIKRWSWLKRMRH